MRGDVEAVRHHLFAGRDMGRAEARGVVRLLKRRGWKDAETWQWVEQAERENRRRLDRLEKHITDLRGALKICETAKGVGEARRVAAFALVMERP